MRLFISVLCFLCVFVVYPVEASLLLLERGLSNDSRSPQITAAAFSRNNKLLAVADGPTKMELYSVPSFKPIRQIEMSHPWTGGFRGLIAFSRDDRYIVAAGLDYRGNIDVYDVDSGKGVSSVHVRSLNLGNLFFSSDGSRLIAIGYSGLYVWEFKGGVLADLKEIPMRIGINVSAVNVNLTHLAIGYHREVEIWDIRNAASPKKVDAKYGWPDVINHISISPDATRLVIGSGDNNMDILDLRTGKRLYSSRYSGSFSYSPNGHLFAHSDNRSSLATSLKIRDARTMALVASVPLTKKPTPKNVYPMVHVSPSQVVFSQDSRVLVGIEEHNYWFEGKGAISSGRTTTLWVEDIEQARKKTQLAQAEEKRTEAKAQHLKSVQLAERQKSFELFRKKLATGDDSHCGLVIQVKSPLAKIQTAVGERWFKISQVFPARQAPCRFYNGEYVE